MMGNALVWLGLGHVVSSCSHAAIKSVWNKSGVMSLCRELAALFHSLGVYLAKEELAAELFIRRSSVFFDQSVDGNLG